MKRYRGKQKVQPGVYFNLHQAAFKSLEHEGPLPGTQKDEYLRVPTLALLVAGPIVGGAYVIFLPISGFSMLFRHVAGKMSELAAEAAELSVRVLKPVWEPGRASLSRGKGARRSKKKRDRWAEKVKKELTGPKRDSRPR